MNTLYRVSVSPLCCCCLCICLYPFLDRGGVLRTRSYHQPESDIARREEGGAEWDGDNKTGEILTKSDCS